MQGNPHQVLAVELHHSCLTSTLFGTTLSSTMVTVGGYLTDVLGELPKAGTRHTTDELLFHVLAVDPNRVRRVYIRRLQQEES